MAMHARDVSRRLLLALEPASASPLEGAPSPFVSWAAWQRACSSFAAAQPDRVAAAGERLARLCLAPLVAPLVAGPGGAAALWPATARFALPWLIPALRVGLAADEGGWRLELRGPDGEPAPAWWKLAHAMLCALPAACGVAPLAVAGEPAPDALSLRLGAPAPDAPADPRLLDLLATLAEDHAATVHALAQPPRLPAAPSSSETLRALLAAVPEVIARVDRAGRIHEVLGGRALVSPEDLAAAAGTSVGELWGVIPAYTLEHARAITQAIAAALASGATQTVELQLATPTQTRIIRLELSPLTGEESVVCIVRDVTQAKQEERTLAIAERMSSLGTLAAGVAHEINNPLAFILANQEYVLDQVARLERGDPVDLRELHGVVVDARDGAERVRRIVRSLRGFARVEEMKRELVDVDRIVQEGLQMAGNEVRHRARVEQSLGCPPAILADSTRLLQVMINLLVNAAQALPGDRRDENLIRLVTRKEGDHAVIEVQDNGRGIPTEILPRIFDPFFTTKGSGHATGLGLGLSICHRIITDLGGTIQVTSQVARGTTFYLRLPLAQTVPGPAPADPRPRPEPISDARHRILIVDDEPAVLRSFARALRQHDVHTAESADAALEYLRDRPSVDLIVCDLMMPEFDGVDLFEAACGIDDSYGERFLFVTGGTFTVRSRSFIDTCRPAILEKPVTTDKLRATVTGMIAARQARERTSGA
jgi:signal transduction histidine kinase/ActR/RegA family two-component response regulator